MMILSIQACRVLGPGGSENEANVAGISENEGGNKGDLYYGSVYVKGAASPSPCVVGPTVTTAANKLRSALRAERER